MLHGARGTCLMFSRKESPWPPEAKESSQQVKIYNTLQFILEKTFLMWNNNTLIN
jgi:hypothetical protein